jgi:hypothetical protein
VRLHVLLDQPSDERADRPSEAADVAGLGGVVDQLVVTALVVPLLELRRYEPLEFDELSQLLGEFDPSVVDELPDQLDDAADRLAVVAPELTLVVQLRELLDLPAVARELDHLGDASDLLVVVVPEPPLVALQPLVMLPELAQLRLYEPLEFDELSQLLGEFDPSFVDEPLDRLAAAVLAMPLAVEPPPELAQLPPHERLELLQYETLDRPDDVVDRLAVVAELEPLLAVAPLLVLAQQLRFEPLEFDERSRQLGELDPSVVDEPLDRLAVVAELEPPLVVVQLLVPVELLRREPLDLLVVAREPAVLPLAVLPLVVPLAVLPLAVLPLAVLPLAAAAPPPAERLVQLDVAELVLREPYELPRSASYARLELVRRLAAGLVGLLGHLRALRDHRIELELVEQLPSQSPPSKQ